MKNVLLFTGLFISAFAYAQTPFTYYFGETGRVNYLRDFTRSGDGNYLLHAYGNYDGQKDVDVLSYQVSSLSGVVDSLITLLPGTQSLYSVEEDGNGGAITCGYSYTPLKADRDITINYLDATGTTTSSLTFGTDFYETPLLTGIDEQQNYFISYERGTTKYTRYYSNRIRRINAAAETVYDISLDLYDITTVALVPLGNGELILVGSNNTSFNQAKVFKLAADGTILWQRELNSSDDGIGLISSGFLDGEELYLIDYLTNRIISLDVENGELLTNLVFPSEVRVTFLFPFVKYQGDFWVFSRSDIYQLTLGDVAYELVGTYPIDAGVIRKARFYEEGVWEYVDQEGLLGRFDIATTSFSTLGNIEIVPRNPIREETSNVKLIGDKILTGVTKTDNGFFTGIANEFSVSGDIQASISSETLGDILGSSSLVLENGGLALVSVPRNEDGFSALMLDIYDASGEFSNQFSLLELADQFIYNPSVVALPANKIAIYATYINFDTFEERGLLFEIDLANPDVSPFQILDFDNRFYQLFSLQDGTVGLLFSDFPGNSVILRKLSFENGLIWEVEKSFPELEDLRDYSSRRNKIVAVPGTEDVLLGINIQDGGDPPVYNLEFFGPTGENTGSFTSINTHLSASTDFLSESELIVVGCDWNTESTGEDDLYQLNYEVYDLSGSLISEVNTPLMYQISITNVEVLDNGFIAVYGRVFQDFDTDALLIIMNEAGDIMTGLADIIPVWGELTIGPNPSSDLLRVQLENDFQGEVAINVYTMGGRLLGEWTTEKAFPQMTWETSLAELPAGSYWVQVKSPAGQVTAGWVKQ